MSSLVIGFYHAEKTEHTKFAGDKPTPATAISMVTNAHNSRW